MDINLIQSKQLFVNFLLIAQVEQEYWTQAFYFYVFDFILFISFKINLRNY